jgi:two-component system response regulator NreC
VIRILLVDDHTLIRDGLRAMLHDADDLTVVAEASDARAALEMAERPDIDIAVVDIQMHGTSGIALTRELRRREFQRPILMLTMHSEPEFVFDAFDAGASGYALKTAGQDELLDAVRTVTGGQRYVSPSLGIGSVEPLKGGVLAALSPREREIFHLLVEQRDNQAIAAELFISPKTVETHRGRILKKLHCNNLAGLIRFAARHHLLGD